ncbi:uncharacterized protein LOC125037825 [Penaeus chinensis]|uniref:uncharacterized protein LOC125037825 n=1 Tax=Penaeus chinensis TaxID=139456 RepID=UPI001FB853BB|nr:uncharacterized protein LOC125037825 [Penaeus chinensis]XP_047487025.1 uncharacterized protein LOC125037825 [Penaeus chinensis]
MSEEEPDKVEKTALAFDDLEDIPSIDCEDSLSDSLPTVKEVAPLRSTSGNIGENGEKKEEIARESRDKEEREEAGQQVCSGGNSRDKLEEGTMQPEDKESGVTDKARVEDGATNNLESPAVTHTFTFPIRKESGGPPHTTPAPPEPMDREEGKVSQASSSPKLSAKTKTKSKKPKATRLAKEERDSDSSVSSRKKGRTTNKTQVKCKFAPGGLEYIEDCLQGRFFSGWVEERRWVEHLGGYRDEVQVDEWEVELNAQLNAIVRSIPGVVEGTKWINITPPSASELCYSLWVLLGEAPSPGHYWFTVTGVAVQPQFGLRISLRILRSIHPQDYETAEVRRKRRKQLAAATEPGQELETIGQHIMDWCEQAQQISWAGGWTAVRSTLTLSNIREAVRFTVVLVITLVVGLVAFLRESHHVVLRFIREAGIFFRNITPFLQSVMGFVEKLIGGFYLLIAMVYRDIRQPSGPPGPPPPSSSFLSPHRQPPLALGQAPPPSPYTPPGPRVVKYVGPEQWVYKSQNKSSSPPS